MSPVTMGNIGKWAAMKKYMGLYILFSAVITIQVIAGYFIITGLSTWSDRGTFGDMFGAVNTLFSGLAFAGVIYAIYLQSKELELQRMELELTRNELAKSAEAQNSQVRLMLHSAKLNAVAAKLSTYTNVMVAGRRLPETGKSSHDLVSEALAELENLQNENV
ncbi:MAG: hypothetical protein Q7V56_15315 [Gammaproteobacteria bacterium]|nr:hypothetical protein [Gammaproteobacteria bacterium]